MTRRFRLSTLALALAASPFVGPRSASRVLAQTPGDRCRAAESAPACFRRALSVAESAFTRDDDVRLRATALGLFRDACRRNEADACFFAGSVVVTPDLKSTDEAISAKLADAFQLFRRGCTATVRPSGAACTSLAQGFEFGMNGNANADSAFIIYRRGCELGDPTACSRESALLEDRVEFGTGARAAAASLAERACRAGSPGGCSSLNYFIDARLRRMADSLRHTEAFRRAADSSMASARRACAARIWTGCNNLGAAFASGYVGPIVLDSMSYYYKRACDAESVSLVGGASVRLGSGWACQNLGVAAMQSSAHDTAGAMRRFDDGCRLFDKESCTRLAGVVYATNPHLSLLRARTACNEGYARGCSMSAYLLIQPNLEDDAEAVRLGRRACRLNDEYGCYIAGFTIQQKNLAGPTQALKYFRRGCELGEPRECAFVATTLERDLAYPDGAREYYRRACDLGAAGSCWETARSEKLRGNTEKEGEYRATACALDKSYCKRKG